MQTDTKVIYSTNNFTINPNQNLKGVLCPFWAEEHLKYFEFKQFKNSNTAVVTEIYKNYSKPGVLIRPESKIKKVVNFQLLSDNSVWIQKIKEISSEILEKPKLREKNSVKITPQLKNLFLALKGSKKRLINKNTFTLHSEIYAFTIDKKNQLSMYIDNGNIEYETADFIHHVIKKYLPINSLSVKNNKIFFIKKSVYM